MKSTPSETKITSRRLLNAMLISLCVASGALALCAMCGCHRASPLDQKVPAKSPIDLTWWRLNKRESLNQDQWSDLDDAIQEIKIRMMIDKIASGSTAVDEAMRERIDNRAVREILQIGFRSKYDRLNIERAQLEVLMHENADVRTRPGDTESAEELRYRRKAQSDDLEILTKKIAQCESKLQLYDPDFGHNQPNKALVPTVMSVTPAADAPVAPATTAAHL